MADEGFEPPYHVPQQSRRHKLRVNNNNHLQPTHLYPSSFYDPSLISSDLINLHRQTTTTSYNNNSSQSLIKPEGNIHLMSFIENNNNNNIYSPEPPLAIPLNPNSIHQHHINIATGGAPFYNNNNNYDRAGAGAAVVVVDDQSFHHNGKQVINQTNTTTGQQNCLSLSLSSHHNNTSTLPLELNLPSAAAGYGINNKYQGVELTRSTVPLGPFTGYASVLNGSRFLKPAHQLLEEISQVGRGIYGNNKKDEDEEQESCNLLETAIVEQGFVDSSSSSSSSCIDVAEQTRKKSGLLSLLQEVYKRYKMYYQQVQAVVASFESVAGLSNAAPFANLALNALTKHFKGLKDAITDQLQFATKSHGKMNYEREEAFTQRGENAGKGPFSQRSFHNVEFADQPVWRPQRGLPERAVTVLRAWLFEHFLHPYPTDTDKLMLAKQTGLSRNQVSNWFINARVRLWKPMVEEIHTLETRQGEKLPQRDEPPPNRPNEHLPSNSSFECENTSSSIQRIGEFTLKRNREDLIENLRGSEGPTNLPYENLTHHPHFTSNAGGSNVSLTLGLHQNGVGLTESYPMNAARRFGLDSHGEDYVLSDFGGQNRVVLGDKTDNLEGILLVDTFANPMHVNIRL